MFDSIIDDIKYAIKQGNVLTKIIIWNIGVFVILNLIYVFTFHINAADSSLYTLIERSLSISSDPIHQLKNPWSIITHMFLHKGIWHVAWNMLLLYWFGRIVGDFLGDKRILPLYILGGLAGMIVYIGAMQLLPIGGETVSYAKGASAAVMCMILCAAATSPDYTMHLILVGPVKIKYIAAVILFLDIIGTAGFDNTGGHFAHLGGAFFGMIYVYYLRRGKDLTQPMQNMFGFIEGKRSEPKKEKSSFIKVVHRKSDEVQSQHRSKSEQQIIDDILDKINKQGIDKLSEEEKEILYNASKK